MLMMKSFNPKVLPEIVHTIRDRVEFLVYWFAITYLVLQGRSHFLLRQMSHKKVKLSDLKEIIASSDKNKNENIELYIEVQDLK